MAKTARAAAVVAGCIGSTAVTLSEEREYHTGADHDALVHAEDATGFDNAVLRTMMPVISPKLERPPATAAHEPPRRRGWEDSSVMRWRQARAVSLQAPRSTSGRCVTGFIARFAPQAA